MYMTIMTIILFPTSAIKNKLTNKQKTGYRPVFVLSTSILSDYTSI